MQKFWQHLFDAVQKRARAQSMVQVGKHVLPDEVGSLAAFKKCLEWPDMSKWHCRQQRPGWMLVRRTDGAMSTAALDALQLILVGPQIWCVFPLVIDLRTACVGELNRLSSHLDDDEPAIIVDAQQGFEKASPT